MKVFWGRFALIGVIVLGALLQGGCAAASKASQQRDFDKQTGILVKHMKALQAKGDPLGDYYYALANSDGWLTEVTDPKAITQLFEQAAAKGSMDAKILLALQEASDDQLPGELDDTHGPSKNLEKWEKGLAQLLPLLQQQCNVRRLVLDMGKPRVAYYSIAYEIWPIFRDGRHSLNAQGGYDLLVAKNSDRQKVWESIHRKCPIPQYEWLYE
jgi:hypothetical protein